LLLVAALLAYPVWRKRSAELPAEAQGAREEAVALLRRDDTASREQAISGLRALIARHPGFVEARADLAVALALELDDVRAELDRIQVDVEKHEERIRVLATAKASADWTLRVNVLEAQLAALQRTRQPLAERVKVLLRELEEAVAPVRTVPLEEEPASAVLARARAQALHAGVLGSSQTLALVQRVRTLEGASQHWAAVTQAAYALHVKAPPASLAEAASELEAVREKDTTFLRAYMLGARVAMRQGDPATAQVLLDAVVAFNPNHTLARKLQEWAVAEAREAASSP
jgi:hypothetical protein